VKIGMGSDDEVGFAQNSRLGLGLGFGLGLGKGNHYLLSCNNYKRYSYFSHSSPESQK